MGQRMSETAFDKSVAELKVLIEANDKSIVREGYLNSRVNLPAIGTVNGQLTVTGYVVGVKGGLKSLIVKCSCSQDEYPVAAHNFKEFKTTRCNRCAKQASSKKRYWKYFNVLPDTETRSRLLDRLSAAIGRCHNPKDANYHNYGGRGIAVCQEWREDRSKFLEHIKTVEGFDKPELEMDRIDSDKGYEPFNIRFVSRSTNMKNKRKVPEMQQKILEYEDYIAELEAKVEWLESCLSNRE